MTASPRALRRALLVSLVAGAALAVVPAARADSTTALSASHGVFTGTAGDDLLVIGREGDYLTHNRFALGDPGFEAKTDFDSTVAGIQARLAAPYANLRWIGFHSLEGNDRLVLQGGLAVDVARDIDMGAGTDVIDASKMSGSFGMYESTTRLTETIETIVGSPFDDTINGITNGAPRTAPLSIFGLGGNDYISGSDGPDRLDGGTGENEINGYGGNDLIAVTAPLPAIDKNVDGGTGTDMFVLTGTGNADALELLSQAQGGMYAFDLDTDAGGYNVAGVERARLNLLAGDDFATVSSTLPMAGVLGGAGNDVAVVDAFQTTATVEAVGSAARVTVPLPYGNVAIPPAVVNIDSAVESFYLANETIIATAPGPGGGPHIRTFGPDGSPHASFMAFDPSFTGGVNLALGDLDGDFDDEIIVAPASGAAPQVRVFFSDGTDTGISFPAYDASVKGGVNVAAVDFDGDGYDEIVTAPAQIGGAHIRIWTGDGQLITEWYAGDFGDHGVRVARGSNMGAMPGQQLVVSSGDGAGSLVRVYEMSGNPAQQFSAYSPYGAFGGGVSASRGQFANTSSVKKDKYDEIVTGAGPGGGPLVVVSQRSADGHTMSTLSSFYAYTSTFTGGVSVATCNADGGNDEIVTAPGAGVAPLVRTFGLDGNVKRKTFLAYDAGFTAGIRVACGGAMSRGYGA